MFRAKRALMACLYPEKPFFPFVGEKCCNTTILDPQQLKTVSTVGVGLTFQPFVGATFTSLLDLQFLSLNR